MDANMDAADAALRSFWQLAGGDPAALDMLSFTGSDAQLPSVFHVGALASASIAAQALAAAELWRLRTGQRQHIQIPMRKALAMFRSERYLTVDNKPPAQIGKPVDRLFSGRRWALAATAYQFSASPRRRTAGAAM